MVATIRVADAAVETFRARLRGPLLWPDDEGYDAACTIWNAMIDRRPVLIARCLGATDVIAAVQFAREHELPISVRGGGHNVPGGAPPTGLEPSLDTVSGSATGAGTPPTFARRGAMGRAHASPRRCQTPRLPRSAP